jgi:hypothetical protein
LRELYLLDEPPGGEMLVELADRADKWSDAYFEWHQGLMETIAEATLARHRRVLERVASMDEPAAVAQLRDDPQPPALVDVDGEPIEGSRFYAAMRQVHDTTRIISEATETYLEILEKHIDDLLGNEEGPDDAADVRSIAVLARLVATSVVTFAAEVERFREGAAETLAAIGKHPESPVDPEDAISDHVVMMAHGGHSDAAIARVLAQAFPRWASSAVTRAQTDAGGVSVPRLEARRVQELLTERVRKMRTQRGVAAGRDVRDGKVDPLKRLVDYINRDPEAEPDPEADD